MESDEEETKINYPPGIPAVDCSGVQVFQADALHGAQRPHLSILSYRTLDGRDSFGSFGQVGSHLSAESQLLALFLSLTHSLTVGKPISVCKFGSI